MQKPYRLSRIAPVMSDTPMRDIPLNATRGAEQSADLASTNRSTLPAVTAMVDEARSIFGDGVKVIYAEENGQIRDRRDRRCVIAGIECFGVEQIERLKEYKP